MLAPAFELKLEGPGVVKELSKGLGSLPTPNGFAAEETGWSEPNEEEGVGENVDSGTELNDGAGGGSEDAG